MRGELDNNKGRFAPEFRLWIPLLRFFRELPAQEKSGLPKYYGPEVDR